MTKSSRWRRVAHVHGGDLLPLEANLQPPVLRDGVILRGELVDTLREQRNVPVVTVTGPPGYGKSTLVVQWSEEDERPFTWLTVDRTANDPVVFVTYLMLALQRLGDIDPQALGALGDHETISEVLLPRLGAVVAGQQRPFVLVVDDAGALTSRRSVDVLMTLVTHLPAGSQLVVCGRTLPQLPLSKLLAERQLVSIGPDDLRFSAAEARAMLAAAEVSSKPDEVAALLERTEGWPVAVYLSAMALGRSPRKGADVSRLATQDQVQVVVADYLRETVLAALPVEEQRFLMRTSILDRLSGPLCDAVLTATGSGDTLRSLTRQNLFVVPLDNHDQWYRYHGMFRDMLRQALAEQEPETIATLHSRAMRWLEEAGDYEEAIEHAQAAQEVGRGARLIWAQAATMLATGRAATLRRWLGGFTNEQVVGHAKLALTAAWCAVEAGHPVRHWIEAAERAVFDATVASETTQIQAAIALLHAQTGQEGVEGVRAAAARAAELQAADDLWRPQSQYLEAVAVLLTGHPDDARVKLAETERLADVLELPLPRALCLAQLAVLAIEAADWDEAAQLTDTASAVLADNDMGDSPLPSLVHCATAVMLAKRGHTHDARRLARRCMQMVAVVGEAPPWKAVETRYLLARAHLLLGDTAAARVLLSEAHAHLHSAPDAVWLRDRVDEAWTHVEKFPLATGVGPSALTSAELRVLQELPSHLSFEQIAKRLFISRNTVKTQAIATYRKLGVSSRGEAVERARSLGIIQA